MRSSASTDFYPVGRWDWLYGRGYLWLGCDAPWHPGWSRWGLGVRGRSGGRSGRIRLNWWPRRSSRLARMAPSGLRSTRLAKAMHGNKDHSYSITAEVTDASRRTIVGSGSVLVARDPFRVFVQLERGHLRPGEASPVKVHVRRPDGQAHSGQRDSKAVSLDVSGWRAARGGCGELAGRGECGGRCRVEASVRCAVASTGFRQKSQGAG
jgi:alpha-2-macroglobulin